MKPLSGKVAIVTGASAPNGIGRAIALRLARDGASVVATDVNGTQSIEGVDTSKKDLLDDLVSEVVGQGEQALSMMVDVTRQDDIERCVKETRRVFGRIDILVNNAGSLSGSDFLMDTTAEEWELSFRVNLLGPMMFSQTVVEEMKTVGGGSIVNIGSTGSLGAEAGFGAYTAMKHGLIGLTKTVAAEFGQFGIRCNAVCPGYIMTDMHAAANARLAEENAISVSEMMEIRYRNVALRRAGEPAEVADTVAHLVGPQGAYITGIALPVAGGVPFGI